MLMDSSISLINSRYIPGRGSRKLYFLARNDVLYLEHVVVVFSARFRGSQRGKIEVILKSSAGTKSTILPLRPSDVFPTPYNSWPLMSVQFWGEKSGGNWEIEISNNNWSGSTEVTISKVIFYGTSSEPVSVSTTCSAECDSSRGCAAVGGEFCDACAELRVASTLECVSICPAGLQERNGYCY